MSKIKTIFQCQTCGYISPKWLGKCPDCGTWNSLVEEKRQMIGRQSSLTFYKNKSEPQPLTQVKRQKEQRMSTKIKELDRVLGGGVVAGSIILIGGNPGIGKSTLLLQAIEGLSKQYGKVLYVSGEESAEQIKIRADRLSVDSEDIMLLLETSVEGIINVASKFNPKVMVIDSVQTIYTDEFVSAPGSVSQIRESATKLMLFAKNLTSLYFL